MSLQDYQHFHNHHLNKTEVLLHEIFYISCQAYCVSMLLMANNLLTFEDLMHVHFHITEM